MTLTRTNVLLAVLLGVVALLTLASRVDYTQPNYEFLPDMKYSPAWTAYEPNPNFANERTLQTPVAGTIPRGRMPLYFAATKEDAVRAGEELANPYHDSAKYDAAAKQESVRRGGDIFRIYCISCHGPSGGGDGPVAQRGFPPPPSLLTGNSLGMKDGQLFHILTFGQGNMPDFTAQISRPQRWDAVNYIRSLQPTAESPDTQPSDQTNDSTSENEDTP